MVSNGLAPWHLLLLVLIALVVFGSSRLPDAARGLGQALRILKAETAAARTEDAARKAPQDSQGSQSTAQATVSGTGQDTAQSTASAPHLAPEAEVDGAAGDSGLAGREGGR